ncbi:MULTISPECIES: BTAD domain-containing putative transcriptional regulator [Actinoplanes]|uniref:AfsR/SARP family transcriptional regulator n=1 Tax=Actinoplanes TaxID=1865 RepID=UPI000696B54A|nr:MULTISPECIES: BTAD domain-containing putative transcriptional regulator [Actinoplanes]GLY00512.1 SARP family transcriptional regulator [Actinoplanes sp. NBRC 101535]
MTRICACLLGEFRLTVDGREVRGLPGRRGRDVLAYLLTHREAACPADVLMEAIWPGACPAAAHNRLHVALSGARRALREVSAATIVERGPGGYRIGRRVEVWTDVERFEAACRASRMVRTEGVRPGEEAVMLARGDFLAGEPCAPWALARRAAVRTQLLEVQSRLVACYLARGDFGPAATLAHRVLADDPCNEDVHRALMLCYARTGMRHLALLHYRQVVEVLWDALRVRPSAETERLHDELRRPSPETERLHDELRRPSPETERLQDRPRRPGTVPQPA